MLAEVVIQYVGGMRSLLYLWFRKEKNSFSLLHGDDLSKGHSAMQLIQLSLVYLLVSVSTSAHHEQRSFSPTCYLDTRGEVICDQCPPGYTGTRCDR